MASKFLRQNFKSMNMSDEEKEKSYGRCSC
jgi:hypothetical protein